MRCSCRNSLKPHRDHEVALFADAILPNGVLAHVLRHGESTDVAANIRSLATGEFTACVKAAHWNATRVSQGHVRGEVLHAPERMNALTEGVLAIVLTLLVLELRLSETDESILLLMRDDARVFVAWLISFILPARFRLVPQSITACLLSAGWSS